jgi:predicted deacetylase
MKSNSFTQIDPGFQTSSLPAPSKNRKREGKLTAQSPSLLRNLVVSIHDVSPLTQEATQSILDELAGLGVHGVSLLVVPNHHCRGHILDHPEFCAWLRQREALGDEVAIHGYLHRRDQKAGESFWDKLTTRFYTAGEGEFFDISGADALRVISQARQEFRQVGLDPKGFIAPAWLLSDGADRALQRLGLQYTTRIGGVFDYHTGVHHASQSLVWSSRSWWRRGMSRIWNPYLFRRLRDCPLLRIGVHPTDLRYRRLWAQIKRLTAEALKDRAAVTYGGYLNRRTG